MNRKFVVLCSVGLMLTFTACGGGGDGSGFSTEISGTWRGQMFQASGVSCSDGSFFGAGLGTPTREVTIEITGGSSIGDDATLSLNGCEYLGQRVVETEITFNSTSNQCADSITVTEITEGSAHMLINPGSPQPTADGQVDCEITEEGDIQDAE